MNFKKRVNGSWVDTPNYIYKTDTDTFTTLPAVLYPTGSTATVGLKGQTTQSSIPSPTSPVIPQGTGERTGNLFDESTVQNGYYSGALGYFANDNYRCFVLTLDAGTYTIKATITNNVAYLLRITSTTLGVNQINTYTQDTFTLEERDTVYISLRNKDTTTDFTDLKIMLNTGSTALSYEPYGYKIPISSANTTTPVYLGEVQSTRRIKKLVLTGEEIWTYEEAYSRFWINVADFTTLGLRLTPFTSNAFGSVSDGRPIADVPNNTIYSGALGGVDTHKIFIKCTTYISIADFKAYLAQQYAAGTPVTVWYVLANEETGIVNEPLMKIGDYADEVSGITIPTIAGANTIDVDTTLKPSEVSVNYHGWHPVQSVHERENGAWD